MNKLGERVLGLRRKGLSQKEIATITGRAQSVVSYWVRKYGRLSADQTKRLKAHQLQRQTLGRKLGLQAIRLLQQSKKLEAVENAKSLFNKYRHDPQFMLGLGLYAGEGRKQDVVALGNLDLKILKFFMWWTRKFLKAKEFDASVQVQAKRKLTSISTKLNSLLGVHLKWKARSIDPRSHSHSYVREFGVMDIRVKEVQRAVLTVQTWLQCAGL